MNSAKIIKAAVFGKAYGIGARKFAELVSRPTQKFTRKNAQKLLRSVGGDK